ncbi:Thioesterase superfamily protein [compost metagenome]
MMTVRLRLAAMLTRWFFTERGRAPAPVSRLTMRCGLFDCDINRHMNNSRYLALMDLGRYHLTLVSGLGRELWRRRWFPVLVRAEIDFKRSLKPGDRFVLETSLAEVGTKRVVLAQRFWLGETLAAEALVTGVFVHRGKGQPLAELLEGFRDLWPEIDASLAQGSTSA